MGHLGGQSPGLGTDGIARVFCDACAMVDERTHFYGSAAGDVCNISVTLFSALVYISVANQGAQPNAGVDYVDGSGV